jgi:hypothetical protein
LPALTGQWNGRSQTFRLPHNPHAGCYVLTDAQLKLWIGLPSFYDRDASWVDPLVSACTYAPGKVFALYMSAEPNPWFLQIEHYGTRYSTVLAPAGQVYGDPLLLTLAEAAQSRIGDGDQPLAAAGKPGASINALVAENATLRRKLDILSRSRSGLFKALIRALFRKPGR